MTDIIYPKTASTDDGCDWTKVILWHMNAGARARTCSVFVPSPGPVKVAEPKVPARISGKSENPRQEVIAGRMRKTHTGVVIRASGEYIVKLHETATVWTASSKENYDKLTGYRVGTNGHCCLLLETITPIKNQPEEILPNGSELSAQKLVALMKGKTLSYQAILAAIAKYHPDINMSLPQLQKRVFSMLQSNLVEITRHDDMPVTHFTLISVDSRFYAHSEKNIRV